MGSTHSLKGQDKEVMLPKPSMYGAVADQESDDNIKSISKDGYKPTKSKESKLLNERNGMRMKNKKKKKENNISKLISGWKYYFKSQMFWCSMAYCMLYCSVLDGGSLVSAYLRTEGISYSVLGITKGLGALCGIWGTMLTPCLRNKCGLHMELIGLFTIWLFWFSLAPCSTDFVAQKVFGDDDFLIFEHFDDKYIILLCMIIARCGLWAFDLVENQLMQERVREDVRAKVNGVQVSVSQMFFILVSVLAMIWNETHEFYILVFVTLGNIFVASCIYTVWYFCGCCRRDRNGENKVAVSVQNGMFEKIADYESSKEI